MATAVETTFGSGLEVEIGKIDRELKNLWKEGEDVAMRASLMNFAILSEGVESLGKNNELISRFTRSHACRVILITIDRASETRDVHAWISAHCHLSKAGQKQVCCEQISFLMGNRARSFVPSIVFSHLDSDLPLYLWWQGEFPERIDAQLWTWVDRLIFDSHLWRDPKPQFRRLRESVAESKRVTLCDLNWARVLPFRHAAASFFDHPANRQILRALSSGEIVYAPEYRTTALLLLGWLAALLEWRLVRAEKSVIVFSSKEVAEIRAELREENGAPIGRCTLRGDGATFTAAQAADSHFLQSETRLADGRVFERMLPPAHDNVLDLLDIELVRGGTHYIYTKTLAAAEPLF